MYTGYSNGILVLEFGYDGLCSSNMCFVVNLASLTKLGELTMRISTRGG